MSDSVMSVRPAIDLVIEGGDWPAADILDGWFDTALRAACDAINTSKSDALRLDASEISVVLSDDARMQIINAQHRGKDAPTNVLSFPALEREAFLKMDGSRPFLLGDLVFALETLSGEAQEAQISLSHHMAHLIVHGFLHLLGYDHINDDDAQTMEALETHILATLNIADPYRGEPL